MVGARSSSGNPAISSVKAISGSTLAFMLLAVVWHYWIGFILAASSFFLVVAVIAGYFIKVKNPGYPKKQ